MSQYSNSPHSDPGILAYTAQMLRSHTCLAISTLLAATCLTGCGLVGVTTATATGAAAEVQQAKQAQQIQQQVQQQLQLDAQQDRARLQQAEKDAQ